MIGNNSKRNPGAPLETVIGEGTRIQGGVNCPGLVRLDGAVNGPVEAKAVLIGTQALVQGDIVAQNVVVGGTVEGNITAEVIDIKSGGRVTGDLQTGSLGIAEGAVFEGHCSMSKNPLKIETASQTASSEPSLS